MTKLVLKTTRYSGDHTFFVKNSKTMKKIVKIVAFRGNSGNSGGDGGRDGDGVLNSNHRGTGRGKKDGASGNGFLGLPLASLITAYLVAF